MKIIVDFINYGYSLFRKLKSGGNLLKLLGVIGIAINHVRIDFFKHLNSLSVFKRKEIIDKLYEKYKEEFKYILHLDNLKDYKFGDYEALLSGSFGLDKALKASLKAKFEGNLTKDGLKRKFLNEVIVKTCVDLWEDEDFCIEKAESVDVALLSVENQAESGNEMYTPDSTYSVVYVLRQNEEGLNRFVGDIVRTQQFTKNLDNFRKDLIFYKIEAIV